MELSEFGKKLSSRSGILELMDDLGNAMGGGKKMIMMGGGNPAHIPAVQAVFRKRMQEILSNGNEFEKMVSNYDTPQGKLEFLDALAGFFKNRLGWKIGPENIAITNGSQNAFFFLFNMFAGPYGGGAWKKVLFPLCPEYIGYSDQGLYDGLFTARKPVIELLDNRLFKYHIDFNNLGLDGRTGAICVSRPTNPTGNVLTDDEVARLSALARGRDIPLLIDNAYGLPFPGIIFTDATISWDEHIVLSMSLSKLGLPSTRTGILIAREDIVRAISSINAIVSLANGSIGQSITLPLFKDGSILEMSRGTIRPFYEARSRAAQSRVFECICKAADCRVHRSEGAIFLWLWFNGLPVTSMELYERLKKRNVLVIPGHYFFAGLDDGSWRHRHECIRLTYSQDLGDVMEGIAVLADELKKIYR